MLYYVCVYNAGEWKAISDITQLGLAVSKQKRGEG
jgi:hypothetical protein